MSASEIAANAMNAVAIVLAGRNSIHTWWTGIVGCVLFAWVFLGAKLYADVTLQGFFVVTSIVGWYNWRARAERPIATTPAHQFLPLAMAAGAVALGYAWVLSRFTDAAAPIPDSVVLAFSVLGQLLLMARRIETWWCWLLVNTVAVPLFASRGLYLTAVLYAGFWVNAVVALGHWRRSLAAARAIA